MNVPAWWRGAFAFFAMFSLYAIMLYVATDLIHMLPEVVARTKSGSLPTTPIPPGSGDIRNLLSWAAFSVAAIVVSIASLIYCLVMLREQLVARSFWYALVLLSVVAIICGWWSTIEPLSMAELPQRLTCVSAAAPKPGFLCDRTLKPDFSTEDWALRVLGLKVILNVVFQTAAIVILGSMVFVMSIVSARGQDSDEYRGLVEAGVPLRMVVAGGAVLSMITLTDVLFLNWPLQSAGDYPEFESTLTALTFFHAALGSMTLCSAILFARRFAGKASPFASSPAAGQFGVQFGWARDLILRPSMLKGLAALSPILTAVIAHPLVEGILEAAAGK
jgi:hypothetical protein